jgi:hypothetical protein
MANKFRTRLIHSISGFFKGSLVIGGQDEATGLIVSGTDFSVTGGDVYFENRPFVAGVPVLLSGEAGASSINDLSDVDTQGLMSGDYLTWDGSSWVATRPN